MKPDRQMSCLETIFSALIRVLNRCTCSLLPGQKRYWGEALIAEQEYIEMGKERLMWAAGGISMTAKEVLKKAAENGWTWLTALVLGTVSALIDLHSPTRWPHIFLLFGSALCIGCWRPGWAWRWVFVLGLCLPGLVLLTGQWGPYAVDQFDVFYGLVPATAGVVCGVFLRRITDHMHRNAITR